MKDSILKGTGNSRFLKSAVPAGTSWADALAMLQAGTFPIDFNGINTEGFQQVGTPLNKANLLKDATALTLGLTGDVVPNDMFNALAHAGDLHVWRKTVTIAREIPAWYTLGDTIASLKAAEAFTVQRKFTVKVAASISVDDAGTITMNNPTSSEYVFDASAPEYLGPQVAGKFVQFSSTGDNIEVVSGTWFFETTASASFSNMTYYVTKAKPVNTHGIIPAGTTVTYPVSTNRNAYQEGNDAKPAGYTLGEVKTGKHILSYQHSNLNEIHWEYSSKITVSNDGTVSLVSPGSEDIDGGDYTSVAENLIGKFARPTEDYSGFTTNVIVFFPSDATVTRDTTTYGYNAMTISKYQPVTGYAAIPANTTIEYLGCLGDKARVQVVSYVGTGTYGSGNETKIQIDFLPELLIIAMKDLTRRTVYISVPRSGTGLYLSADGGSSIYGRSAATVSYADGKVRIRCSDAFGQMNASGYTYIAVALH